MEPKLVNLQVMIGSILLLLLEMVRMAINQINICCFIMTIWFLWLNNEANLFWPITANAMCRLKFTELIPLLLIFLNNLVRSTVE